MEPVHDADYERFKEGVHRLTAIDLSLYKESQMKRRLFSLATKKGFATFTDYLEAIKKDVVLKEELLDRITINVTEFFRNPSRWEILQTAILPALAEGKRKLTCWSAACSTGEEPYTLALLLAPYRHQLDIQILATDIDKPILETAKRGIYPVSAFKNVAPDLVNRHFTKLDEDRLQVNDDIRRMVDFRHQNLLTDSFSTDNDLIICRNVTIYFTEEAKDRLYTRFSDALAPGGILFVGSTEQIFHPAKFSLDVGETFFYKKKP